MISYLINNNSLGNIYRNPYMCIIYINLSSIILKFLIYYFSHITTLYHIYYKYFSPGNYISFDVYNQHLDLFISL